MKLQKNYHYLMALMIFLIGYVIIWANDKTNENEDKNNIKNLNNNEETLKIEYNKKTEIKRNELINKIKLESIKDENHEKDIKTCEIESEGLAF